MTEGNGQIIYTVAVFIYTCTLARKAQPDEYLDFCDDSGPDCLSLYMEFRSILDVCDNVLSLDVSSSHSYDFQNNAVQPSAQLRGPPTPLQTETTTTAADYLNQFGFLLDSTYRAREFIHLVYTRLPDDMKQTYNALQPPFDLP
ncbi:hypothetical protein BDW68DRAFT_179985 [Aspergillus falconensis]